MYYAIEDATYSYEIHGEGRPVVLLHGFTGSSDTWSTFVTKYKQKFQLIIIDLPGHGKTNIKTERTMEAVCRDLVTLFQHLKLESVHLVGYSMGGRIALSIAMLYPEWIASLILESSSPGIQSSEEREARIKNDERLAQKIEKEGIPAFVDFWESIPLFATQRNMSVDVQQSVRKERLNQAKEGLAQSLRSLGTGRQPSWWKHLAEFTKPVLLIVGAMDVKFVKINEQMERYFPSADLQLVENAGHAIHVEQPTKFGKLVSEFIFLIAQREAF